MFKIYVCQHQALWFLPGMENCLQAFSALQAAERWNRLSTTPLSLSELAFGCPAKRHALVTMNNAVPERLRIK
jgi:hypothetical protein